MIFEYLCKSCDLIIERDFKIGKANKKVKCPDCNKMAGRYYGNAPAVHFKGMDFQTNRSREMKYRRYGMDKDRAQMFYKESIEATKKRIDSKDTVYSNYTITPQEAAKRGAKRKTEEQLKKSLDTSKQNTINQQKRLKK